MFCIYSSHFIYYTETNFTFAHSKSERQDKSQGKKKKEEEDSPVLQTGVKSKLKINRLLTSMSEDLFGKIITEVKWVLDNV